VATLLLIRHGQASYGEADYDRLSERGRAQARALGAFLSRAQVDEFHVGPLRRQRETMELASTSFASKPSPVEHVELAEYPAFDMLRHFLPKLVELDEKFAALPAQPTGELANAAFHTVLRKWSRNEWMVEGVERVDAFAARVRTVLDRVIAGARSGARIAIVTSAGPIGVAVGLVFGATEHHMVRTSTMIRNASISELMFRTATFEWNPEQISLLTFNSTHHLRPELHTDY
jgi:broad specificity phosphatase PhoE